MPTSTTATNTVALQRAATRRLPDWQPRLARLIAQRMAHPLQWGVHDCCLWAADAVLATTGVDLAVGLRGTYSTEQGAQAVLQQLGGLAGLCTDRLGPVVRAAQAQPGDVGIASVGAQRALVVCGGAHFLAVGAQGLVPLPMASVLRAWRCTAAAEHGEVAHG